VANGLHERRDHEFKVWITRNHSEWSEHSEKSENPDEANILAIGHCTQDHINYRRAHNEKVKLVPTFPQVRAAVHDESHCNNLYHHFNNKRVVEYVICIFRNQD
jgi:hypothetical protein